MLETMRLHGSIVFLAKSTNNNGPTPATPLTIAGKKHVIPANTWVIANSQALHCDTESWGADARVWRPSRWLVKKQAAISILEPREGTYVPWSSGPRICPGKKFSQVEFAGAMAVLFARHRVHPRREVGESEDESLQRTKRMIEDSGVTSILTQMKHPESVALVWTERGHDEEVK